METAPGASAPPQNDTKPRRAPAQKAAQEKGLPQDVFLHENAMGGFTESGRKPKKLKPGVLGDKPKRRRKPLIPTPGTPQRSLDNLPDHDVVVVASMPGPRGVVELDDGEEAEQFPLVVKGVEDAARATLVQALYHEVGKPQSLLTLPAGNVSFSIRPGLGSGEARSSHRIHVPLPGGNATNHLCDLSIELENGAIMVIDVLTAQSPMSEVKARAFDALQLRGLSQCYAVLVFVQGKAGLERDHVEAVAHGYDHFFGVDADHASDSARYTALKARVAQWIKAASK
jgi:hypothetical protein